MKKALKVGLISLGIVVLLTLSGALVKSCSLNRLQKANIAKPGATDMIIKEVLALT